MSAVKSFMWSAVTIVAVAQAAAAHEHDGSCERIHVPGHYETRLEKVSEPGRWVDEEQVTEVAGRYETKVEMVETPGRFEMVERQVWVEGRWIEGTAAVAEIGSKRFKIGIGAPCRTWVPGHYETVCERVWVPARCERREVEVWVPPARRVEVVRVFKPGCTVERPVKVWVPGRYEVRCAPARVIRPEAPRCAPPPAPAGCGTPVRIVRPEARRRHARG